ncbi:hypothetical protein CERSUDRAFT_94614 [Gelatoporia subvermispora B]|uniref:Uncharacterized protein n=1 Tax=Ceriporiopsis subvermispora (strain B) TaxID=914234 RepID=M2RGL8_CERS8|nr:hypothetical protein CERSUDRAFT_94614 [Gelatoporia subvermispora B]
MARNALDYFLAKLNVTIPVFKRDKVMERRVLEITNTWPGIKPPWHAIVTGVSIAITAYDHIEDFETKLLIAVYTAIATTVDCPDILDSLDGQNFHRNLCLGSVQHGNDIFVELTKLLATLWDHFPPYSANLMMVSILEHVNLCLMENASHDIILSSDSRDFLEWRRDRSGASIVYAGFIWDKKTCPDERVFIQAFPSINLFESEIAMKAVNYVK